jgi:hypothetical protein
MRGTGNRQKLSDALNGAKDDSLKQRHDGLKSNLHNYRQNEWPLGRLL